MKNLTHKSRVVVRSLKRLQQVNKLTDLTRLQQHVMLYLASAGPKTMAQIIDGTKLSRTSVLRARYALEARGLVRCDLQPV